MKLLYKSPLPEASTPDERDRRGTTLAEAGILDGGDAVVEAISDEAPDLRIEGVYPYGRLLSGMLAEELEELANSFEALPLYRTDERYEKAGYYEISTVDVEPAHPNAESVVSWSLDLSRIGKRGSKLRTVETNPREDVSHEFGNELETLIGVPASASKVQWVEAGTKERSPADAVETRTAEFGDVALYDLGDGQDALDSDDVLLAYDVDYAEEARHDVAVYDDIFEAEEKYLEGDNGRVRVWESVYSTSHDFGGEAILDNGLLRIRIDEAAGTLEVEEWDPNAEPSGSGLYGEGLYGEGLYYSTGAWIDVGLEQPDGVGVWDVDVRTISMVDDRARIALNHDGDLVTLDVSLQRGHDSLLVELADEDSGPIPDAIEDWLDPIANESVVDVQPSKGLISKRSISP